MDEVRNLEEFVSNLLQLPKKILKHYHTSGLVDLVLSHLASKHCFNLKTAAYFLDNPEFDCIKGVSGFHSSEVSDLPDWDEMWNLPAEKINSIHDAAFNQKVKNCLSSSLYGKNKSEEPERLITFAKSNLALEKPAVASWHGKHGNHGILFYEYSDEKPCPSKSSILEFASAILGITHF